MNNTMKYILILCLLCGLAACEEEQPELFADQHYIRFNFENSSSNPYYVTNFSFATVSEDIDEQTLQFPVEFRGNSLVEDMPFRLEVTDSVTTLPADAYTLELEQLFHAGQGNLDSVSVTVKRSDVLDGGTKVLRFALVDNENFITYMPDSLFIEIRVSNTLAQPDWWGPGSVTELSYLGKYSDTKYTLFINVTGISDFNALDPSEKRHYAIQFKRYLEANPQKDEDDSNMSVAIAG